MFLLANHSSEHRGELAGGGSVSVAVAVGDR